MIRVLDGLSFRLMLVSFTVLDSLKRLRGNHLRFHVDFLFLKAVFLSVDVIVQVTTSLSDSFSQFFPISRSINSSHVILPPLRRQVQH